MNSEDMLIVMLTITSAERLEYIKQLNAYRFAQLLNLANNKFMQATYILNDISIAYSRYNPVIVPFREEYVFESINYVDMQEEDLKREYNLYANLMNSLDSLISEMEIIKRSSENSIPV